MNLLNRASKIAEGFNSSIYHLRDNTYGKEVILKSMKDDFNSHAYQLYNEDRFLRNIKIKGVRASLDLVKDHQIPILVLEYFDGKPLKDWRKSINPSFWECLNIAIQITEPIVKIHSEHQLIHRDISAHNILINTDYEIRLIDFGLATDMDIKHDVKGMSDQLLGTLPYLSPEQTGRVNHAVDFRSDLYSLGVVLYELFTGQLPFEARDPLELIHAHLVLTPVEAHLVNPTIPKLFSDILNKLLDKKKENRYQSAHGLLADLKKCRDQLDLKIEIHPFNLAEKDEAGLFQLPTKIYGRDHETLMLTESIQNIGSRPNQITLVSGKSGIGKTSLMYEVYKPLTSQKGHFIKGKHQQFQKDRPYQAIVEALNSFISMILSENDERLTQWGATIQQALGGQGKLITDLIPNLELIIGKQEKLPMLGINEAQNRFHYVFGQFIRVLSNEQHPLVLFIDDLQWADSTSLKLLKQLITDPELNHFYFIGAYRDNEVDDSHPFTMLLHELSNLGTSIQEIHLENMRIDHVQELIQDTFNSSALQSRLLANIIFSKTAGNPFFISQFLKSIYDSNLIWFDSESRQWAWNLQGLESTNFTDNVIEFMIEKMSNMDKKVRTQLTLTSCIGDSFDIEMLRLIQEDREGLIDDLWPSVIEQFLIVEERTVDTSRFRTDNANKEPSLFYRFAHDRIRQAAYELIPEETKSKVHQQIGELLLTRIDLEQEPERVFDVIDQLNMGEGVPDEKLRVKCVQLNLQAGLKASIATANDSALHYFSAARDLLKDSDWQDHYDLCFKVSHYTMESYYLLGQYEAMDSIGKPLLKQCRSQTEKLKTNNVFIHALIAQGKYKELIQYSLAILRTCGIKLSGQPSNLKILLELALTKLKMRGKSINFFKELPEMDDESLSLAINMMTSIGTASYHSYPKLFPLVVFKSVRLSIDHGNSIDSIPFYGAYGTILCGAMHEYELGVSFGKLSLSLQSKDTKYQTVLPKTVAIYYGFISHWTDHLRKSISPIEEALIVSLENGDNQYAATSAFQKSYIRFLCGDQLSEVGAEMDQLLRKIEGLNQKGYYLYQQIVYQTLQNLTSQHQEPWKLEGSIFSCKAFDAEGSELNSNTNARFLIAFHQLYFNFLFRNSDDALEAANQCKQLLDIVLSTAYVPVVYFYDSLICLQLLRSAKRLAKKNLVKRIQSNLKQLKKWADVAPMNFLHKYLTVKTELTACTRPGVDVKDLYHKAIQNALDNEYLNEAAVIYELAGRHYHAIDHDSLRQEYLTKAYKAFKKWGAVPKAEALKKEFPFIQVQPHRDLQSSILQNSLSFSSMDGNNLIDLASVLKAASTISSEIQLSKAIPKLLSIVMENAGAQSAAFILIQNKEAKVHTIMDVKTGASQLDEEPVDQSGAVPTAVIQYVHRTRDTVILDEPHTDNRFLRDPYLQNNKVACILCLPLIYQQKLTGIIYLENRLIKGNFSADQTDLLSLLSGQIAITIHNAMLYETLEQKVIERTKEIEKQKETLHRQNQQLIDLNEEKDFLISVVSHDLRNPLQLIKGYTNLVLKEKSDEIDEYLGHIIESSERMENFISRILNVSAINSRELNIQWTTHNIIELLEAEVQKFLPFAEKKNIQLNYFTFIDQLLVKIDKGYFQQIMENLLSNAVKYTHKNGTVEVSVRRSESGNHYRIEVKDNGQGITFRDQKLLFSKFQKLSAKPTDGESSTGLGLAIVKKYVEAMNGHIWCESEYEKGSTFFVEFLIA